MFKIGDRVRVIKNNDFAIVGMVGTIKYQNMGYEVHGVEFDTAFQGGHSCRGYVKEGHGQWVDSECLELIKKPKTEKIVITHDGKTTLARLYENNKVVKSAEAKCDPRDEFIFKEGAKLAFERLTEEKKEPPKFDKSMLTNGRFGCISDGNWFVVVGDNFIYKSGDYDELGDIDSEGKFDEWVSVAYIVEALSFDNAKVAPREVIWCAPDFDPKEMK